MHDARHECAFKLQFLLSTSKVQTFSAEWIPFLRMLSSIVVMTREVDLAETDENERGNENEQGKGRQEGSHCGIGRRPCKLLYRAK